MKKKQCHIFSINLAKNMLHWKRLWRKEGKKMAITKEEAQHVAHLAKLSFSREELPLFTQQMGKIMDMVELLETVDTAGIPLTVSVTENSNVYRLDVPEKGTERSELLKNVPTKKDGFIQVPAMLDNGEEGA